MKSKWKPEPGEVYITIIQNKKGKLTTTPRVWEGNVEDMLRYKAGMIYVSLGEASGDMWRVARELYGEEDSK